MKHKKIFKKVLALALSLSMTVQIGVSAFPESVFALSLNTDYTIYSENNIVLNMNSASINGNVSSGNEFKYLGNGTCYVNDTLNSDKISGSVQALEKSDIRAVMPDYRKQLENAVNYKKVYTDKKSVINTSEYSLNDSVHAMGGLWIERTSFSGKGYIRADGDIQYDAVKNSDDSEIFLYSSDGNITVQGTNLTINGIIYAPEGTVEINAKNLTINGAVIAKNIELNGTDLKMNRISDMDSSLITFGPEVVFDGFEGTYRQNRKITLDISESFGLKDIDIGSLNWDFYADSPASSDSIKIDEAGSSQTKKNLIITEPGIYHVCLSGKDKDGKNVKYFEAINVTEDIAPVAGFWNEYDSVGRNEDGKADIVLEDTSYSPDGDNIGSRVWSVLFDSDNDGDFSDENEVIFKAGNEKKVTYTAGSVGKYKFRLTVAEYFEDTIPALLSEDAYLVSDTSGNEGISSAVEVTNEAPGSYSGIKKARNVDIVVTVGNAELEDIDTLNKNIDEVKTDLESKGYSVNLKTVSTSTLTARDKFAWTEYDHENYSDIYLPTLPKHILYENDSIKMVGYSVAPLRDWLFVDDCIKAKRILSFDMVRDKTDWHSMEGGGFLFNTAIRENIQQPEDPSAKPVKTSLMTGFAIILSANGFNLVQFDNMDVEQFRNGGWGSVYSAGKRIAAYPVKNVYDDYNVKIIANDSILSVYINDNVLVDNYLIPETEGESGTGFGPIICHGSHSCSQQSYFTFSNIRMSTVNGSELSEVLNNSDWRDSAEHFVINLSKNRIFDLNDNQYVGSAVKSLIENDTKFIGLGTAASKEQYDMLLRSADGMYSDWYDVLKNKDIIRNYILNSLSGIDYDIDDIITTSDEVEYSNSFVDKENDPVGQEEWEYELDASVYENSKGTSGRYTVNETPSVFENTGLYKIWSRVLDDPTNSNAALDSYKKWSEKVQWTDGLYVHSRPTAQISSEISVSSVPDKFVCELEFSASDTDSLSKINKGIAEEKFEWKCIDDLYWTEGTVPKLIEANQVYLQKYTVRDEQGAWSVPCVEMISAKKTAETENYTDEEPPVITITASDQTPGVGDEIIVSVSAEDNTDIAWVRVYINDILISRYQGSFVYKCGTEGDIVVKAECADVYNNPGSAVRTVTVTDRRDLKAPEIIIDTDKDIEVSDSNITINGTVKDDTAFDSYKVSYSMNGSEEFTDIYSSGSEVNDSEIVSFKHDGDGDYTIMIEASDKSKNKAYCRIELKIEKNEVSDSSGENITEPGKEPEVPEKTDTPAGIKINTSAQKAEIGEIVNVDITTEDKDGLVEVKVFKNDVPVADGPVKIRFTESKPGIVVLKVQTVDALGGRSEKSIEIIFEDNSDHTAPTAEITAPENNTEVSGKVSVSGSAFDETAMRRYVLEYRKSGTQSYIPLVSSLEEIRGSVLGIWDTFIIEDGTYEVRLTVTDNGGNTTYANATYVVSNTAPSDPEQNPDNDSLIIFNKPQNTVKSDEVLRIEAKTDSSLRNAKYELSISSAEKNGEQKVIKTGTIGNDDSISVSVDSSMFDEGKYIVTLAVGNDKVSAKQSVTAEVIHKQTAPAEAFRCIITTPEEMAELKDVTEFKAEISPEFFNRYKFEYSPAGKNSFVTFASDSSIKKSDVSGMLDTTILANGYYDIRFTAYGDKYTAQDMITVNITGNLKIGNFTLSFNDLRFDVNGVPVSVIRTYDSRTRNQKGCFGYGWDMKTDSASVSMSTNPAKDWKQEISSSMFITTYEIKEAKSHRISVDLGNGIRDEFAMTVSPQKSVFFPIQYDVNVDYKALNGSKSKLEAFDISSSELIFLTDTLFTFELELYEPEVFLYTRNDGTKYLIDKNKGLLQITASNGELVKFEKDGIKCSGDKSVLFTYDAEGRITEITGYNGKKIKYEYDIFGDLVCVTDEAGNSTKFVYKDHYITENYDPRGILVSRNEYDENGRLVKTVDSAGNEITYEHDIEGRQEIITDRNDNQTVYNYDENGNITAKTDANGNTVKYDYDSRGNKTKQIDAAGNVTEYTYDNSGLILKMTDAEGNTVTNGYDSRGMITSVNAMGTDILRISYNEMGLTSETTDALGNVTNYNYDTRGRLKSVTDEIGTYMNMTYDGRGNVISATNGAGTVSEFTYDSSDNCISKKITYTSEGEQKIYTENYTYDDAGNAVKVVDSNGNIVSKEYNSIGKVIRETDEKGRQTVYDYDDFANVKKITYPDGTSETFTYDAEGNNLTATDRLGRKVTMTYDKVGNLVEKKYFNGLTEKYSYDANYNLISKTDVTGTVIKYEYDKAGKNTAITDALGNKVSFTYNSHAQLASMTDAKGNVIRYTYDDNGNRTGVVYQDGTSSSAAYDARGRMTSQTDQNGNVTSYSYDGADRLTAVKDALGNVTGYSYDEVGNLVAVTDAEGRKTTYVYDDAGRVVKTTNAAGASAYITYDVSGNILSSSDFGEKTTKYTYDSNDRMVSKITADQTYTYSYTADGKLSSVRDNRGTTSYFYNDSDGLTKVVYPDGKYVEYGYNQYYRLTSVKTPYGTDTYSYDELNRPVKVVDKNGYATIYSYDANGNRSEVKYANGITVTYIYDELNRLTEERAVDKNGICVASYKYSLGKAGERIRAEELDRTVEYTYDSLYRLTGEKITDSEGNVTEYGYEYDKVSNRTVKTENGNRTEYKYNKLNQLISENDISYEYDASGNLIVKTEGEKISSFTYNAENRMIRATVQEGNNVSIEEYTYDHAGNRTSKITESETITYLNDVNSSLTQVLAEIGSDGKIKCHYTRGTELISQERDGVVSYYLTDGHGSVRHLTDSEGNITDSYVYDAWGNMISAEGKTENSYLYCGEQFDNATGLYYLRARYMDPSTGTFVSMDTYQGSISDPISLHKYLYANANPVMNIDPSGYFSLAELSVSSAINDILDSQAYANYVMIYQKIKGALNVIDTLCTIYDIGREILMAISDPDKSGWDILEAAARGIVTGVLINRMCQIKRIGPILSKIFVAFGAAGQFESIISNIKEGNIDLAITGTIQLLIQIMSLHQTCFTGETLVAAENGQIRIDEIKAGDKVWAYDINTGKTELKEVLSVYVHDQTEILHLHTTAGDIDTTTNHPFYVIGRGWVAAGDINEGDEVFLIDGSTAVVTGAELEKLEEPIKVYNLEVEDYNTFFVGDEAVLVHNYETEYDLYAAGRNGGNPSGRSKDFGLEADTPGSTMIDGNMKPSGNNFEFGGASSFETLDELRSKLNNPKAFKLPSGTTLPEGLGLKQDIPGGHNTLYPTLQMTLENFYSLVRNLPWILIGR